MIDLSLNEAAALARKAARGAGHDWGMADEAGRAVRWLCARDVPALDALARLLRRPTGPPRLSDGVLSFEGPLCPLRAGAALADLAALAGFDSLRLRQVEIPLLVLPFAAAAARTRGRTLRIEGRADALTDGMTLSMPGDWLSAADLTVTLCDMPLAPCPASHRAPVDPETHAHLDRWAQRTYAPATDASRRLGAGE